MTSSVCLDHHCPCHCMVLPSVSLFPYSNLVYYASSVGAQTLCTQHAYWMLWLARLYHFWPTVQTYYCLHNNTSQHWALSAVWSESSHNNLNQHWTLSAGVWSESSHKNLNQHWALSAVSSDSMEQFLMHALKYMAHWHSYTASNECPPGRLRNWDTGAMYCRASYDDSE